VQCSSGLLTHFNSKKEKKRRHKKKPKPIHDLDGLGQNLEKKDANFGSVK
jgi:hypothetical protein